MKRAPILPENGARFVFSALVLVLAGCGKPALTIPELNGVVVDAATSRPLPGARVLVAWEGEIDVLVDSQVARIRLCKTTSDVNGRFHAAAWRAPGNVIGSVKARAFIHLPGYHARAADSATEHTGPELVTHPLYSVTPGENTAQDDLVFANEVDCAEGFADTD